MRRQWFIRGVKNGVPICLGYLGVSFAFGMMCVTDGLTVWQATLISLANLTSAGQFAGLGVIVAGGSYLEMALTQLVINLRYMLMSFSLSQKIDKEAPYGHRFLVAFGITDEIFAVSVGQEGRISPWFSHGATLMGVLGWTLGTFLGALLGSVLPGDIVSALSVALYAMFLAIVIPPAKKSRAVLLVVLAAMGLSSLFRFVPALSGISSGFVILICTITVAGLAAVFLPTPEEKEVSTHES